MLLRGRKEPKMMSENKDMKKETAGIEASLDLVRFNIFKKNYDNALRIIEELVTKIEDMGAFEDDQVSEYHVFDEPFEEFLYQYRAKPEKDLKQAQIPYTEIYLLYGSLLVEMKRLSEARVELEKGLRWNPVSFCIMSEYIETYKMSGELGTFFKLTKEAFKLAFRSDDLARCYRNLGYYFVEKELWSEAIACYLLSLQYETDSRQAQSELYYINSITNGEVAEPSLEEVMEYGIRYGFPIGADDDIVGLSLSYGKEFLDQNEPDTARYFLSIAYDLTGREEIAEMMGRIPLRTDT